MARLEGVAAIVWEVTTRPMKVPEIEADVRAVAPRARRRRTRELTRPIPSRARRSTRLVVRCPTPPPPRPSTRTVPTPGRQRSACGAAVGRPSVRCVVAGLLLAASMPPWGWWPLAFPALALVDRVLAGLPWRSRLHRGAVVGWTLFVPTILWITQLTAPGYVIAVLTLGGLVGVFFTAVPPNAGRRPALIGAWVLCESLRTAWPFGGVPLSLLAVGQAGGPLLATARIGGVLLIAALTVAGGVALSAAYDRTRTGGITGAATLAVVLMTVVAAHLVAPRGSDTGETVEVAPRAGRRRAGNPGDRQRLARGVRAPPGGQRTGPGRDGPGPVARERRRHQARRAGRKGGRGVARSGRRARRPGARRARSKG